MRKFKAIKKYTVNTKEVVEDNKKYKVFESLKAARDFARDQFRASNFVSLTNFKRVVLPI